MKCSYFFQKVTRTAATVGEEQQESSTATPAADGKDGQCRLKTFEASNQLTPGTVVDNKC